MNSVCAVMSLYHNSSICEPSYPNNEMNKAISYIIPYRPTDIKFNENKSKTFNKQWYVFSWFYIMMICVGVNYVKFNLHISILWYYFVLGKEIIQPGSIWFSFVIITNSNVKPTIPSISLKKKKENRTVKYSYILHKIC